MTVCSYQVTYAFQNEPTLCSCLNIKEVLAWNRRDIWSLSDCYGIRTQKPLSSFVFVYKLNGCGFESRCRICLNMSAYGLICCNIDFQCHFIMQINALTCPDNGSYLDMWTNIPWHWVTCLLANSYIYWLGHGLYCAILLNVSRY